jgi:hypothetical protein
MCAAPADPILDPPSSKDLTHLIRDNQFQLELLEARIGRLRKDLAASKERAKGKTGPEPWSDPAQALRVAQGRLLRLKQKLASRQDPGSLPLP